MTSVSDRPLITFALIAYNQERYIAEAVQGAFSQTYSPLEIILSDDCSSDRTFEIMQEMAKSYQGSHIIVLNRNEKNLNIGGHVNRIMELARGELVVIAAGDDVSFSQRTERIFEAYMDTAGQACSLFSDLVETDSDGKRLGYISTNSGRDFTDLNEWARLIFPGVVGATHAWHRKTFDFFGPMLTSVRFEDRAIPLRSALLGSIKHIEEPLVRYRKHELNASRVYHTKSGNISVLKGELAICENAIKDIDTYMSIHAQPRPDLSDLRHFLFRRIRKHRAYLKLYEGTLREKAQGMLEIIYHRGYPVRAISLWWQESWVQLRKVYTHE